MHFMTVKPLHIWTRRNVTNEDDDLTHVRLKINPRTEAESSPNGSSEQLHRKERSSFIGRRQRLWTTGPRFQSLFVKLRTCHNLTKFTRQYWGLSHFENTVASAPASLMEHSDHHSSFLTSNPATCRTCTFLNSKCGSTIYINNLLSVVRATYKSQYGEHDLGTVLWLLTNAATHQALRSLVFKPVSAIVRISTHLVTATRDRIVTLCLNCVLHEHGKYVSKAYSRAWRISCNILRDVIDIYEARAISKPQTLFISDKTSR